MVSTQIAISIGPIPSPKSRALRHAMMNRVTMIPAHPAHLRSPHGPNHGLNRERIRNPNHGPNHALSRRAKWIQMMTPLREGDALR
jgi:hypothetical protein